MWEVTAKMYFHYPEGFDAFEFIPLCETARSIHWLGANDGYASVPPYF